MKKSLQVISMIFLIALVGIVHGVPDAQYTATPLTGHPYLTTIQFVNATTGLNLTYAWDFGDGGTSTLANPFHVYGAVGVFTTKLVATGDGGNDNLTRNNYITITADDTPLNTSVGGILDSIPPLFGSLVSLVIAAGPIMVILALVGFIIGLFGAIVGKIKL